MRFAGEDERKVCLWEGAEFTVDLRDHIQRQMWSSCYEPLLRQTGASAVMIEELLRGHEYQLSRLSDGPVLPWKAVGQDESVDCVASPEECQEFKEMKNWGLA